LGQGSSSPARILIVARRTADSPELVTAVSDRAARGPCTFTLLVPSSPPSLTEMVDAEMVDAEDHSVAEAEAHARLDETLPRLSAAAGQDIQGIVGTYDPLEAIRDALNLLGFDEVIVSMLPIGRSRWLRRELPRKVRALGVPVTAVITTDRAAGTRPAVA
jgi:hypothetical protein